jgi:hypothetical protein
VRSESAARTRRTTSRQLIARRLPAPTVWVGLGEFGVGDPALPIVVPDRLRIADRGPGRLRDVAAARRQAPSTAVEQYAESARTSTCPVAPAARATPIASATSPAVPRAEPAFPPRSLLAATTGAASGVQTVVISGDRPRSSTG